MSKNPLNLDISSYMLPMKRSQPKCPVIERALSNASFAVVAGAKPNPVFPVGPPRLFVGAHGGIIHANRYDSNTEKWGCITNMTLDAARAHDLKMWSYIAGTSLDRLFIFESINRRHERINFLDYLTVKHEVVRIPRWRRTLIEFSELGLPFVVSRIAKGKTLLSPLASFKELFTYRTLWKTKLSMGMLSTALVRRSGLRLESIFVAGVGLSSENYGYEYDTQKVPINGHLVQDQYLASKYTNPRAYPVIEFTDKSAASYLRCIS